LILIFGMAIAAAPALAARGHEFAGAFGWGVVDGKAELQRCKSEAPPAPPVCQPGLSGNGLGQFENPGAIAVNESTGDVYVVDENNNRVEIFNAQGSKFEGEFNGSGLLPNEGQAAGSGGLEEEVATGEFDEPNGIAVDNDPSSPSFGDVYVTDAGLRGESPTSHPVVDKFDASGKYIGQITRNPNGEEFSEDGFARLFGVAVDPRGEVWVEERNFGSSPAGAAHYTNAVANAWIPDFRSSENGASAVPAPGFAVDSEDNLYVHNTFGSGDRLAKFDEGGELLSAEVDEEVPTGVAVEAGSDDVYIAHASNVHRVGSSGTSLETLNKVPGTPSFSGVGVNVSTLTVYVSDPASNRVDVFAPEAPGHPTVQEGSEAVSDVSATSANFSAEINPRSEPNEEATSYTFQYGPCDTPSTCSSSPYPQSIPSPEGILAPNYEPDPVSAHPQDLSPHTVYHMRVVAHNSHPPEALGEELIFTTQTPGAPTAPDDRQFELVSPPDKHGAIIFPIVGSGVIQASVNGDSISYLAYTPTEAEPPGNSEAVQVLSRRGSSSWLSEDIATPHEATVGVAVTTLGEYRFFSEDLSRAIVQPFGPFTQAISPQGSERTAYLRSDFPAGDPSDPCTSFCYRPLVSGCPGGGEPCPAAVQEAANVPGGTKFGEEGTCGEGCGPSFLGASPDASHIVLSASAALTEGAPEGEGGSLYEWAAGKLTLVSVLPNGQAAALSTKPMLGFVKEFPTIIIARQAITSDGSRIAFSEQRGAHHLYLRDVAKEQTIQLDAPEAACTAKGKCKGTAGPIFQTASVDDSRILFTDSQPLTQGSSQIPGNSDLYECEIEEDEEGQLHCKLSDLTSPGAGEEGAGVLGLVAGASEDGAEIYFTANGKLSTGPNPHEEEAVAGDCKGDTGSETFESETAPQRCNLYARVGGQTRLVAVLSGADFPDWSLRGGYGLRGLTARVSPDGRYLAFMSRQPLTGYDNHDAVSAKADEEVFLYDSGADSGQGGLSCASCNPSGGRPHGVPYAKIDIGNTGLAGGARMWPAGAGIAASVPGWTAATEGKGALALHQSRYLSNSGRLFFNSADALVPQDSNKTEDVYQYEHPGVGDCSSEKPTFGSASGGCVALISSGTAKEESAFLDASESGDDVFFLTGQRLLPSQDLDTAVDVYDDHACSGASPCLRTPPTAPPACEGDACQSPGLPPEDPTPGSLTYHGPGTPTPPVAIVKHKSAAELKAEKLKKALKACHKQKRKRAACEAKARKLYGPHKAKKAKKRKKR
jgi:hypothetical protein